MNGTDTAYYLYMQVNLGMKYSIYRAQVDRRVENVSFGFSRNAKNDLKMNIFRSLFSVNIQDIDNIQQQNYLFIDNVYPE